jgi:hypothetical protein
MSPRRPATGLSVAGYSGVPRSPGLRLHLDGNAAGVIRIRSEDVDARHVAGEGDRVAPAPMDFGCDVQLPGSADLLCIHRRDATR